MATFQDLVQAISNFEGFSKSGSLAQRNNNPGNLVYAPWEAAFGGTPGGAGGFAVFPTAAAGAKALQQRAAELIGQGASISSLVNSWAGTQYGNTSQSVTDYTNYLSKFLGGIDPLTSLGTSLGNSAAMAATGASDTAQGAGASTTTSDWTVFGLDLVRLGIGAVGLLLLGVGLVGILVPTAGRVADSSPVRSVAKVAKLFGG